MKNVCIKSNILNFNVWREKKLTLSLIYNNLLTLLMVVAILFYEVGFYV